MMLLICAGRISLGVAASIPACHAGDPSSILGVRALFVQIFRSAIIRSLYFLLSARVHEFFITPFALNYGIMAAIQVIMINSHVI